MKCVQEFISENWRALCMSKIRLRYASGIAFLARIISLFTGFLFTLIVTRNLSVEQFGQWTVISSLVLYGTFPAYIVGYWLTRFAARGEKVATLGLTLTIPFALAGCVVYVV